MSTLLVGCFTDDSGAGGLHLFETNGATLSPVTEAALASPAWLVAPSGGSQGSSVVAVGHTSSSPVTHLTLGPDSVTLGASRATSGSSGCHGEVSPDGSAIAVAHYDSGSVAIVPVEDEGWGDATVVRLSGHSGADPDRQEAPHAHQTVWLDDEHLLVCDLGADAVRVLRWLDGHLSPIGTITTTPGFGPRHLVLRRVPTSHGEQVQIAVAGELDGTLACFRHHGNAGTDWARGWERVSQVSGTLVGGSQPSALRAVDEHTLVVANRSINTLALLEWHDSGQLVLADEFDCGGDHPRDVVVHEGAIWVANQNSGDLCCFTRTDADGEPCGWRLASRTAVTSASGGGPASMLFL